jgi:HAD superfamily hydrolase (TIGR01509 family)
VKAAVAGAYRAVVFDLDGLLLDSEAVFRRAWQAAIRGFGHEIDDAYYATLIGRGVAVSEGLVATRFAIDAAAFRTAWRARHRALIDGEGVPPRPGAIALLDRLAQRRVPFAIATSSIRADAEHALGERIARFPVVITGDQVQRGKPDPEIYLTAAAALGVPPAACIGLEDSNPGLAAAHAAGMAALMVPDLSPPTEVSRATAHGIYPSLVEARIEIERLLSL